MLYQVTKENTSTNSSTNSSSSTRTRTTTTTTTNSTRDDLVDMFQESIGIIPPALVVSEMEEWLVKVGYDTLRYALHETACAPRPSWRYASAILRRCEGIKVVHRPGVTSREAVELGRAGLELRRHRARMTDDETMMPYDLPY